MWLTPYSSGGRASRTTTFGSVSAARRSAVLISGAGPSSPTMPSWMLGAARARIGCAIRQKRIVRWAVMRGLLVDEGRMQGDPEPNSNRRGGGQAKENLGAVVAVAERDVAAVRAGDRAGEGQAEAEA